MRQVKDFVHAPRARVPERLDHRLAPAPKGLRADSDIRVVAGPRRSGSQSFKRLPSVRWPLLALCAAPGADAAKAPTRVEVGKVRLAAPGDAGTALLVPVRYPIQLVGRPLKLRVALRGAGPQAAGTWVVHTRAGGGAQRRPERRRGFTFVHRVDLGPGLSKRLRAAMRAGSKPRVLVRATARLDADRDGKPELRSSDNERQLLGAGKAGVCSDLPRLRTKPGRAVATKLPVCGSSVSWRIAKRPEHGTARIRGDRLIYRPARKFRGSETIALAPRRAAPPAPPNPNPRRRCK